MAESSTLPSTPTRGNASRPSPASQHNQFAEYAIAALESMGLLDTLQEQGHWAPDRAQLSTYWLKLQPTLRALPAFTACQLLLSPLIEQLFLLDRVLFLFEYGCHAGAIPLFDPAMSPRNSLIVATKTTEDWDAVKAALPPAAAAWLSYQ